MDTAEIVKALMAKGVRQEALADDLGVTQGTVSRWLSGSEPKGVKLLRLHEIAKSHGVVPGASAPSPPAPPPPEPLPPPNARIIGPVDMLGAGERIKVLGQAVGGSDGRFLFNGETMAEIFAPSQLWGVRNAYAVYVSGDSMEPRYFAGETVYVNPHMPARQGDFVVVQVVEDAEELPSGYIKQFVSMTGDKLRLRQFNPAKDMTFDRARVMSVHKIVGSGV